MTERRTVKAGKELARLDSMLDLFPDYQEMYAAIDLPIVVTLESDTDEGTWAVLAGVPEIDGYVVQGISFLNGADGFEARLSLDASTLTYDDGYSERVSLQLHRKKSRPSLTVLLEDFSGRSTPFDPIKDSAVAEARLLLPKLNKGADLHKLIASATKASWERVEIFDTLKGWYRTMGWERIRQKRWPQYEALPSGSKRWQSLVRRDLEKLDAEILNIKSRLEK